MVTTRCILCGSTANVFKWPKDVNLGNKWTLFVTSCNAALTVKKSSGVCKDHFLQTDFKNYSKWEIFKVNRSTRLKLHESAVPCIANAHSAAEAGTGERRQQPKKRHRVSSDDSDDADNCVAIQAEPRASTSNQEQHFLTDGVDRLSDEAEKQPEHLVGDVDYDPNKSFLEYSREDAMEDEAFEQSFKTDFSKESEPWKEIKFIIPWSFILWALANCRVCGEKDDINISRKLCGAALEVHVECVKCGASYSKSTSEKHGKIHALNYLLSALMLFTGCQIAKIHRVFELAGIAIQSTKTVFRHQKFYLNKVVRDYWLKHEEAMVSDVRATQKPLRISGDSRCDSMGHSAKYGCYTIMDVDRNRILTLKLVQTEGNSQAMEFKGLKECLNRILNTWKLPIDCLITDRHIQIRAYMRDTYGPNRKTPSNPSITHYLDVWHCAKSLKKDLKKAADLDNTGAIKAWSTSIVGHLYWVPASSADVDIAHYGDVTEAKWRSLANHISNKHTHSSSFYPKCAHGRRKRGEKKKNYLRKNTAEHQQIVEIVENKNRIKDVRQLSPFGQTSCLESFHGIVNHYAPKMIHFHHRSMLTRIQLAAIHYNENADRDLSREKSLTISHPKFKKGEATVKAVSSRAQYGYINKLLMMAYEYNRDPLTDEIPPPMSSLYSKTANPELLKQQYTSRFTKK